MLIKNDNYTKKLVDEISFDILLYEIGQDLIKSIESGISYGAVFPVQSNPLTIFRNAVAEAITDIEEKGEILCRFLKEGPYWNEGEIPKDFQYKCLTDEETAKAISFIYCHIVNCFQGKLAELLAIEPLTELLSDLMKQQYFLKNSILYVGDSILTERLSTGGIAKSADFHIIDFSSDDSKNASILGIAEVKSYYRPQKLIQKQLHNHIKRVQNGLNRMGNYYSGNKILLGENNNGKIITISIVPSSWHLPRKYVCEKRVGKTFFETSNEIPEAKPTIRQAGENDWRITLKWSHEAIAQEAYELTFWYMAKLGERIFSKEMPKGITDMTPAQAGQNAAKQSLYYSMLRCKTTREEQRAIALYNTYCFGYTLGMNFKNEKGRREMLWIEDLYEISEKGKSKYGCRIWE